MDTYITAKGQIVIPSKIRRKFGIKEGTRVHVDVDEQGHRITLTPITRDYIQSLCKKYKGKGLLKALVREKRGECDLRWREKQRRSCDGRQGVQAGRR